MELASTGVLQGLTVAAEVGGARVVSARTRDGHPLDCAEVLDGATGRWRAVLSTLSGCPVRCATCDAGGHYEGRLTAAEMLEQLELLARLRFGAAVPTAGAWDVHFTRMGDPAFNGAVLDVLEALPARLPGIELVPLVSTVAPASADAFFSRLRQVRRGYGPNFTLQLSLFTSDETARRRVVPVKTWSFSQLASYGAAFHRPGDAKVRLVFAATRQLPLDADALRSAFDPAVFSVRLTPLTPTAASTAAGLTGWVSSERPGEAHALARRLALAGFDVEVAFTPDDEVTAGAACGQYAGGGREGPVRPRRTLRRARAGSES